MQQPIVKSFLQFVNENEEPKLNIQPFLVQLADLIRNSEKFETVSVESNADGMYIEITKSENIHDWADVRDSSGDAIRIYADYKAKVLPLFTTEYQVDINDLNSLIQHGLADVTNYIRGFATSAELNCWSKDINGWTFDDGSDEMEEESLEDLNITPGGSIESIAEELVESIDDRFNQFYTAEDVLQSSLDEYEGRYDDDEDDDEDSEESES